MAEKFEYLEGSLGKQVKHKMMGVGTVTEVNKTTGVLVVKFRNSSIRFQFPNSFNDGTLSFIVPETTKKQQSAKDSKGQSVYRSSNAESWESDDEDVSWITSKKAQYQEPKQPNPTPNNRLVKPDNRNITVRTKSKDINNPYDDWEDALVRKCENCKDYRRGDCAGLGDAKTCADYSPIPRISNAEKFTWPTQGDALNFKIGKK